MTAERSQTILYRDGHEGLDYVLDTAKALSWNAKQIQIRKPPKEEAAK
jgi:hypothetical protein